MKKLIVVLLNLYVCFAYYGMQAAAQDQTVVVGDEEFDFTYNTALNTALDFAYTAFDFTDNTAFVVPTPLPEKNFEVPYEVPYIVTIGSRNYECSACTYVINKKVRCQRHIDTHHPKTKEEGTCGSCSQFFLFKKDLEMHVKSHSPQLYPNACTFEGCIACFKKPSDLRNHLNSHNGISNFECEECKKAFVTKGALTHHLRVHKNDKLFKCCFSDCFIEGIQITQVKQHAEAVHKLSKEEIAKRHKEFYKPGALEKMQKSRFKK